MDRAEPVASPDPSDPETGSGSASGSGAGPESADAGDWLERHGDALFAFARSRGVPAQDAEDLVQETLLTGLERWPSFRRESSVRTWLTGIMRFKVLERGRSERRWQEWVPEAAFELFNRRGKWRLGQPARWRGDPEALAEDDDFRRTFLGCLERLPRRLADAFLLVQHHGLEPARLAPRLGVTINNLHVMLYRARAALRQCLERSWFREEGGK